ncbi:NADH-quinone oxidoreductase subunit D [Nocardioides caldifontis]|uniref:NADH-quinone oxidoreductase subunit D n=1 Tax=Nocardioides caldifontis TaxID=2588938 RepID=UPI001EF084B2|nr:NADH-quinone oxidoreductase subunit D [Nocardioides caldifontis]
MTPSTRALTVAVGPAAAAPSGEGAPDLVLDLGPSHPSTHGGLRLRLALDGDRITACEPEVGFLHRGAEKLFEARDYRQVVMLVNRHDWLSAFANELGVVLAVERMLGIEVPPRAVWLRTVLAELNRVLHHLLFLGTYPPEIGEAPRWVLPEREALLGLMEELTGGRMHFMFNRVGGVKEELPAGWLHGVGTAVAGLRAALPRLREPLAEPLFEQRTRGVGVLTREAALDHGVSGPVARASGLDLDLRRDEPYLGYAELDVAVPIRTGGDAWSRFAVLVEEVAVSLDLVEQGVDRLRSLPPGPLGVRLPKIVKAPEGATYAWTESPGGLNGYYLVSHGEKTPWRLKLRSPGFNNASALPALLRGATVADLVPVLGSLFFVVGDIDK